MNPRVRRYLLLGTVLTAAVGVMAWTSIHPSIDRNWIPEQARLPEISINGNAVHIRNVRDFTYRALRDFTPHYDDRAYDLSKLVSVWYVLTPFSDRWRGPAHSFVSFGFADSQFVSISVEARREPGETYDAVKGLFKRFELMYVVGDERDLIGQRAVFHGDSVYLYPIKAKPERIRAMFVAMVERANRLREHPEFYNTLTNNCTSNVVSHVNQVVPKTVPGGIKTILPGYTDEVAHRLGLIDTDLDLADARKRYVVNARAKQFINDAAFSVKIRQISPSGPRTT